MLRQIPARKHSRVREERMNARLRLRRVENQLGLAALLRHRVIVIHGDRAIRAPLRCDPYLKHEVVETKRQPGGRNQPDERPQHKPPDPVRIGFDAFAHASYVITPAGTGRTSQSHSSGGRPGSPRFSSRAEGSPAQITDSPFRERVFRAFRPTAPPPR
jgi:hypothetical protein